MDDVLTINDAVRTPSQPLAACGTDLLEDVLDQDDSAQYRQ
jgi:hypothetical protein